ncbi:hypothetical protein NDU88_002959 [Pleurodeles waltl]|uniref:Uncharacterized protein n=1 Tax=Pleurodeles waltl TaxID=8319 RepID=A0AAV7UCZ6_PLEWA|nr:hypothetical protein NDU88_002959 [Pleurodeles waltl]
MRTAFRDRLLTILYVPPPSLDRGSLDYWNWSSKLSEDPFLPSRGFLSRITPPKRTACLGPECRRPPGIGLGCMAEADNMAASWSLDRSMCSNWGR